MARRKGAGERLSNAALNLLALLVILLMCAIALQVFGSLFDVNPVWTFEDRVPLFGDAVTLNSLLDLQWHLLAVLALFPAGIVWLRDGHVRVDFIYSRYGARGRRIIDFIGNLLFAFPFLVLSIPGAWSFATRAWRSGEGSSGDGLVDLWIVKMSLFVGLVFLALAVLRETIVILKERGRS